MTAPETEDTRPTNPGSSQESLIARYPWLVFVLPFAVYMLIQTFEPVSPEAEAQIQAAAAEAKGDGPASNADSEDTSSVTAKEAGGLFALSYKYYPAVYSLKIVMTLLAIAFVWPGYRQFPWRLTVWGPLAGALGAALWIALASRGIEYEGLSIVGLGWLAELTSRSGFNPLAEMGDRPAIAYAFLFVRFFGLSAVVPLIEEGFLRGLVMRYLTAPRWEQVPFGAVSATAIAGTTVLAILMHPFTELLAELIWFSLITGLMLKTRNFWDCVVAHGVTNLLLGIYVVASGAWHLM